MHSCHYKFYFQTQHQPKMLRGVTKLAKAEKPQLILQCKNKWNSHYVMFRGSSTTDGRYTYFAPGDSNSIYCYEWRSETWKELLSCLSRNFGLVTIEGKLTAVGGMSGRGLHRTKKLLTLHPKGWAEDTYPEMSTARSKSDVVCSTDREYIIVVGGNDGDWTATVEMLQVKNRMWHKLTNLPKPLTSPSALIRGNELYAMGGGGCGYSCSIEALSSTEKPTPKSMLPLSWTPLPRIPVMDVIATTLLGHLVIIGGDRDRESPTLVYQLVESTWIQVGSLQSARKEFLVATPTTDMLIVVGGKSKRKIVDIVEEYHVTTM
jgi:hypothetical protein